MWAERAPVPVVPFYDGDRLAPEEQPCRDFVACFGWFLQWAFGIGILIIVVFWLRSWGTEDPSADQL